LLAAFLSAAFLSVAPLAIYATSTLPFIPTAFYLPSGI
jgi:hypothetical protein